MTATSNRRRVVVIDPLKLRQAGLVRLLQDWAESKDLEILAIATPEDHSSVWAGCAMVVLNAGGASVSDGAPQRWIKIVKTFMSDVPIVILSDREDCGEIRSAFRSGVSGFIPATLEPALAMEALTFLSRGGSFFPCSVLLDESQTVRESTARSLRDELDRLPEDRLEPALLEPGDFSVIGPCERPEPEVAAPDDASRRREYAEVRRTRVRIAARARMWDGQTRWPTEAVDRDAPALTPRQNEVLQKLGEGKSNKLIARDLDMTEATVKVHVRQIMRKFGASNRTQAALYAMRFASIAMARRAR